jgi:hypothetical protein
MFHILASTGVACTLFCKSGAGFGQFYIRQVREKQALFPELGEDPNFLDK